MMNAPKIKRIPIIEPNIDALMDGIVPKFEVTREMLEAAGYRISIVDEKIDIDYQKEFLKMVEERPADEMRAILYGKYNAYCFI